MIKLRTVSIRLEEKKFSDLKFSERGHLQEWLANEPMALGEELLINQKEFDGFDDTGERLDLLALDKDGIVLGHVLLSVYDSQKPRRKRYASGQERRGMIKNRVSIDDRPKIVDQKTRIGDWEGDTVIGKNHRGGLVTLAERKSRYVLAGHIRSKHADGVTAVTTRLLTPYKDRCHTITFDNGKEFAEHERIAAELQTSIYFAHPYHSWERGLNENSNGLLRQYFPRAWS